MEIVNKHYEFKTLMSCENFQIGTMSSLSVAIYRQKYMDVKSKLEGAKTWL